MMRRSEDKFEPLSQFLSATAKPSARVRTDAFVRPGREATVKQRTPPLRRYFSPLFQAPYPKPTSKLRIHQIKKTVSLPSLNGIDPEIGPTIFCYCNAVSSPPPPSSPSRAQRVGGGAPDLT